MSRYAWLLSEESKETIWLGKYVEPDEGDIYFHIGNSDCPNSDNPTLVKAIMKFISKNYGKSIRVVTESQHTDIVDDSYKEISDDPSLGILFEDYLKDFRG